MKDPSCQEILDIFYPYVAVRSETGTVRENQAAAFFRSHFRDHPYFTQHPSHLGSHLLPNDPQGRSVEWALVKGKGSRTVVLVHHFDVVETGDYGGLGYLAFDPVGLEAALGKIAPELDAESRADLESGAYIFGRGTADMKAGGALQMALVDSAGRDPDFQGNLLLLALPDEENLSAGMRAAAALLAELRDRFRLEYALMVDSEPHQRKNPAAGVLSGGSIGKILPFVYVRGVLAHAGKSPEGFNPLGILGGIVCRTEMSFDFCDSLESDLEMSPPPTWLMARDSKETYDVSMPASAFGILSVHSLSNRPARILKVMLAACEKSAAEAAAAVDRASELFRAGTGRPHGAERRGVRVFSFGELLREAQEKGGEDFETTRRAAGDRVRAGVPLHQAVWSFVDLLAGCAGHDQAVVVTGFLPPYYPGVSHRDRPEFDAVIRPLAERLSSLARERWGQAYELESFFTGISDLSYSSILDADGIEDLMRAEMPLYGDAYSIPFGHISSLSMPCMNIGPWGKDFHRMTERVLREDLVDRTSVLLAEAVRWVLSPAAGKDD